MNLIIEQSILASLLWSFQIDKNSTDVKMRNLEITSKMFLDPFHRRVAEIIEEFEAKNFIVDEILVSERLVKTGAMQTQKWFSIITQTAGGMCFLRPYARSLRDNSKKAIYEI